MQMQLPIFGPLLNEVEKLLHSGIEERGAIYTRSEVVDFILDLSNYTENKDLCQFTILEPSFGEGSFLFVIIKRLLKSFNERHSIHDAEDKLIPALRAVEVHQHTFHETKVKLIIMLQNAGIPIKSVYKILSHWLLNNDFLQVEFSEDFDFVIGNPPYIRQESISSALLAEYRFLYKTMYDRADLYVAFYEKSLCLLKTGGVLGFICSDRWMKNKYGKVLRKVVSEKFHLRYYVDMYNTNAFESSVVAYPAITIISKESKKETYIAHRPKISKESLNKLLKQLQSKKIDKGIYKIAGINTGEEPWLLDSFDELALARKLEKSYPTLEAAGCKVGIGVASGADKVYIKSKEQFDIEEERLLPIVRSREINSNTLNWKGGYIINPYEKSGQLASLDKYPRFASYLEKNRETICKRHVAKKNPKSWYKTIDRIYPELLKKEKLLIPDIKGEAAIVLDKGNYYPHHNLYYIISDSWDLRALQAVLLSGIAKLFISLYSTKMNGGCLRFQAQYLRRIRLPEWINISNVLRNKLIQSDPLNQHETLPLVAELYGLDQTEISLLKNI